MILFKVISFSFIMRYCLSASSIVVYYFAAICICIANRVGDTFNSEVQNVCDDVCLMLEFVFCLSFICVHVVHAPPFRPLVGLRVLRLLHFFSSCDFRALYG